MVTPSFENEYGKGWIEDRILFFAYKQGVVIDVNAAKRIADDLSQFQKGISYPLYTV